MAKQKRLIVSFWNIALENFPAGVFSHRTIPADEAKKLIDAAKEARLLVTIARSY